MKHATSRSYRRMVLGFTSVGVLGLLLALTEGVVRTDVSKLGAVSRWEFSTRVLGLTVYRTTMVANTREEFEAQTQTLRRGCRWGAAACFALGGAGLAAAAASMVLGSKKASGS